MSIALSVFGIGCITFNDSMMKMVVNDHPIGQAIFIRGVFVLLLILLLVYRQGGMQAMRIDSLRLQFWLAVLLVLPIFLFMYALSQLPLSIATIIFLTTPYSSVFWHRFGWANGLPGCCVRPSPWDSSARRLS